jgi:hypothetical protein
MRHSPSGSPFDVVTDAVMRLRLCHTLEDVERAYPVLVRTLEFALRRVTHVSRQGGASPGLHAPARWLDTVLRDHAALDSEEGETIRAELRGLVARIRERA